MTFVWLAEGLNDIGVAAVPGVQHELDTKATKGFAFIPSDLIPPGASLRFYLRAFSLFAVSHDAR
jgi:hypothetical protein